MMRRITWGGLGALILALSLPAPGRAQQPVAMKIRAPELVGVEEWINAKPTTLKSLRGKVVALHFWAFG